MKEQTASNIVRKSATSAIDLLKLVLEDEGIMLALQEASTAIVAALKSGNKILFCGNGGSAADAQHLAAELSGPFYRDRPALAAEALHCNTSYLTAVANDYSYDVVYSRLVKGIAKPGDILVGLSTSGNSKNVVLAFESARGMGMKTIGFTGQGGGDLAAHSDILIAIPSKDTPRIQEVHMLLGHSVCEAVESSIFPAGTGA